MSRKSTKKSIKKPVIWSSATILALVSIGLTIYFGFIKSPSVNITQYGNVNVVGDIAGDVEVIINDTNVAWDGSFPLYVSFEYGEIQGGPYPFETPPMLMTQSGSFSYEVTGLTPNTTYYYRVKADAGERGITYGNEMSFTTLK